ncbi:MAG TPA: sigma-70 family RNA polymerase sigma factor [Gemmataceae bacterium]|nr:sigma-70 family RNA polymerase sigma factor [Gemmataceae bacterium]
MMRDVSQPLASDHPVAVALKDAAVQLRLANAARALLGKRAAELSSTQRTAEAEVIVQEAAARAWKHKDRFDASRDVVKWLIGYIVNVAREFAKKRGRDASSLPEDGPGLEALAVDPSRPVDDAVTDTLLARHLLDQLPPTDRQIVEMKYWDEMTCAEIGQRLDMQENAVRIRLYRAIQKLKQMCGVTGEGQP